MADTPAPTEVIDDRPRFRWVVPLGLGLSLGAVLGIVITFAAFKGRSSGSLIATKFDPYQVRSQITTAELTIQDTTANIGTDSFYPDGGTSVRRRIEMTGRVNDVADLGRIANNLKGAVDAELMRHGVYTSGGGSSSSSSLSQSRMVADTRFYKGRGQGQVDIIFHSVDRQVNIVILIHEGR